MAKTIKAILVLLSFASPVAGMCQASPAGTASVTPGGPSYGVVQSGGTLNYSLGASEAIITSYNGGSNTAHTTNVFGTASLVTSSESKPTSLIYSGGYLFSGTPGEPSASFQNLGLSQVITTKHWYFVATDFVSYLPSSPTTGVSGIAGVGDVGTAPVGGLTGQGVLTNYATRISNNVGGTAEARVTGNTSINTTAGYSIQRFINSVGIDNSVFTGSIGPQHRIDALNTVGANYTYSRFTYGTNPYVTAPSFNFISQGGNLTYEHVFTRTLSANVSIGPQWTKSGSSSTLPTKLNFATNTSLNYTGKLSHASLYYYRGADAGSGVLLGAISDSLGIAYQGMLDRNWSLGVSANYSHISGLLALSAAQSNTQTFFGGLQISRKIGRNFSAYASYNAQQQSINGTTGLVNAFSGLSQVLGFGLTYSPPSVHLGRH